MNKIAVFLPTRKGSQRLANKNTRTFAGMKGGLLFIKLSQLSEIKNIKVYLSSNDPKSIEIGKSFKNTTVFERPDHLCLDTTSLTDLIKYVPKIVEEDHILWTHVTSPLVNAEVYNDAIDTYFKVSQRGNDSLMSVHKMQEFIWSLSNNDLINRGENNLRWPRTQDLEPLYVVNSAFFIGSRDIYRNGDRVGEKPFLYEMDSIQSIDVDWEDDFKIAEALYEKLIK